MTHNALYNNTLVPKIGKRQKYSYLLQRVSYMDKFTPLQHICKMLNYNYIRIFAQLINNHYKLILSNVCEIFCQFLFILSNFGEKMFHQTTNVSPKIRWRNYEKQVKIAHQNRASAQNFVYKSYNFSDKKQTNRTMIFLAKNTKNDKLHYVYLQVLYPRR